jgi:transcriptional regulator with XRE-family HTH domain
MQLVATATSHGLTFPRMASDRALPPAQNDALRRRLRDLVATKYGGTITHAARALGVSHATLSDVLSGNRGVGQKLLNGMADVTGSTIDALLGRSVELEIPLRGDVRERNLACAHELLHGLGLRLGLYLNETDWWLCTAAFVAVAAQSEEGALLYPFWMLEAVPSHLIPG